MVTRLPEKITLRPMLYKCFEKRTSQLNQAGYLDKWASPCAAARKSLRLPTFPFPRSAVNPERHLSDKEEKKDCLLITF